MSTPDPPQETQPETSGRGAQQTTNGEPAAGGDVVGDAAGPTKQRVLAVYCSSDETEEDKGFDPPDTSNILHLAARPGLQVSDTQWLLCHCAVCALGHSHPKILIALMHEQCTLTG